MSNRDSRDPTQRNRSFFETSRATPWLVGLLALVLAGASLVALGSPAAADHGDSALVVDEAGSGDFAAIQPAIDHANASDTIRVLPGTYEELVTIDKDGLTLCSSADGSACDGAAEDTIVHALGDQSPAVTVAADGVSFQGFFVNVAGEGVGIDASGSSQAQIEDNTVETGIPDGQFGIQAAMDAENRDWWLDSFVVDMLTGDDLEEITQQRMDDDGFLAAEPRIEPDDHVALLYEGSAPDAAHDMADTASDPAIEVYEDQGPLEPLIQEDAPEIPEDNIHVPAQAHEQFKDEGAIAPGAAMDLNGAGCTANWIWTTADQGEEIGANDEVYVGTAGHCVSNGPFHNTEDETFDPNPRLPIRICIKACDFVDENDGTIGTGQGAAEWVTIADEPEDIHFARGWTATPSDTSDTQPGDDFALIQVPTELYELVDPSLMRWDGVDGSAQPQLGDVAVQHGYGLGLGGTFLTQARAGVFDTTSPDTVGYYGAISPGDSGSAAAIGALDDSGELQGSQAAGLMTHASVGIVQPARGTSVQGAIDDVAEWGVRDWDPEDPVRVVTQNETVEIPIEGPPLAPINVAAVDASTTDELLVDLSWELPEDSQPAETYTVLDADGNELVSGLESTSLVIDDSIDPNLAEGQESCYQVRASNSAGDSDLSQQACATPELLDFEPIDAPIVNTFDLERGDTIASVWTDPALPSPDDQEIVGYNIKWVVDGEFYLQGDYYLDEGLVSPVVPEERTLHTSFAEEGETYEFTVRAIVDDDRVTGERLSAADADAATVTSSDPVWKQAQRTPGAWASTAASTTVSIPNVPAQLDLGGSVTSAPLIADLTGDGDNEVLLTQDAGATDTSLDVAAYGWSDAGFEEVWRTSFTVSPETTNAFTQPAIGDFDGDGDQEVALVVDYVVDAVAASGHIAELHFLDGASGDSITSTELTVALDEPLRVLEDASEGRDVVVFPTDDGATSDLAAVLNGFALTANDNADELFSLPASSSAPTTAAVYVDDGRHDGPSFAVGAGTSIALCQVSLDDGEGDCETIASFSETVDGLASTFTHAAASASIVAHVNDTIALVEAEEGIVDTVTPDDSFHNHPALGEAGSFPIRLHDIASGAHFEDGTRGIDVADDGDLYTHEVDDGTLAQIGALERSGLVPESARVPHGPVIADVAGDEDNEILVPDESGTITAVHGDELRRGEDDPVAWETDLGSGLAAPLTIGDVTEDGRMDVLAVTDDGQLSLIEHITDAPDDQIGIDISSTADALVANNGVTAHGDETDALGIVASGSGAADAIVEANDIDVDATGIYAGSGSDGMIVEDNQIHVEAGWCSTEETDFDAPAAHRIVCDKPNVRGVQVDAPITVRGNTITSDHAVLHTDDGEIEVAGTWGVNVLSADATIEENELSGWGVAGVTVWRHDAHIEANTFTNNSVGVHLASNPGETTILDNQFEDNAWAVRFAGSSPATEDVELRENALAQNGHALWLDNDGMEIDARLNDWGVVGEEVIKQTRVQDDGEDNEVLVRPYLDANGDAHPPLPEVRCPVDGDLETVATPLNLQAAVDLLLPTECDDAGQREVAIQGDFETHTGASIEGTFAHALTALPLDEADGSTAFEDHTVSDHDATCEEPACPAAGAEGAFDQAPRFDGVDDVLTVDSLSGFEAGTGFSVEAWIQIEGDSSVNDFPRVVSQGNAGTGDGAWSLVSQDDGSTILLRAINASGGTHDTWAQGLDLADGEFHQVVATYDGTTARIYVDGELAGSEDIGASIRATDDPIEIGNANDERPFNGVIDEVALYDEVLAAEDITGEAPTATIANQVHLVGEPGGSDVFDPTIEASADQPAIEALPGSSGTLVEDVSVEDGGATGIRIATDAISVLNASLSGSGKAVDVTEDGLDAHIEGVEATFSGEDQSSSTGFHVSGDGALLEDVDALGWENGITVSSTPGDDAEGVEIRDSRLRGNVKGLQDRCDTTDLSAEGNLFIDNAIGVQVCQDEIELRENAFRANGEALRVTQATSGAEIDARLNDWGVYENALVSARASDQGQDNRVLQVPFLDADGTPEPGLPVHAETGESYLSVQAALDAAEAGDTVQLPGSNHTDPNPYVEEIAIEDAGVTLCAAPNGTCEVATSSVAITAPDGSASMLSLEAADVTVEGIRLTAPADGQTGVHATDAADGATIAANDVRSWATGILVEADDVDVAENAFALNDVGADLRADGTTLADNEHSGDTTALAAEEGASNVTLDDRIHGSELGIAIRGASDVDVDGALATATTTGISIDTGASEAQPSGVVVNNTRLGLTGTPLALTSDTESVDVDATCNDWGAYHPPAIEARIQDGGSNNTVDYTPWQGPNPEVTTFFGCLVEPVADFSHEPKTGDRNTEVNFTDETRPGSTPIVEWSWEFGDGSTSKLPSPSHTYDEPGLYQVNLTVRDANLMESSATGLVEVVNLAPRLAVPADIQIPHTEEIQFPVTAEDPEGDDVHLTARGEPLHEGANFTVEEQDTPAPEGNFSWEELEPRDRGVYEVEFVATDELGAQTVDPIEIEIVDDPPVFEGVTDASTRLEHPVSFALTASDANGDPVHLSVGSIPDNATLAIENQDTAAPSAAFAWTPTDPANVGTHEIAFTATSEGLITEHTVLIEVGEENTPPTITIENDGTVVDDQVTAVSGEEMLLNVTAEDPDGLLIPEPEVSESPSIDSELTVVDLDEDTHEEGFILEAEYIWTPGTQPEPVEVEMTADDGFGEVNETFTISVIHPPEVESLEPKVEGEVGEVAEPVLVGETFRPRAEVSDTDEDLTSVSFAVGDQVIDASLQDGVWLADNTVLADTAGDLAYEITATDDEGLVTTVEETIAVEANPGPVANASVEEIRVEGGVAPVSLDASNSSHPEDRPISVSWALPSSGSGSSDGAEAEWIPPGAGVFTATVTVTDHLDATDSQTVTIIVEDAVIGSAAMPSHPDGEVGMTERPTASVYVIDEVGMPIANADVNYTVSHELAGNVTQIQRQTAQDGVQSALVPFDTDTQPGVNLEGAHELEIVMTVDSQFGQTPAVIEDRVVIPYTVNAPLP